jgi:hypothetical protein
MIRALKKLAIEGICLNIRKTIHDKPATNIILNGEKLKAFFSEVRNKIMVSTFIQYSA